MATVMLHIASFFNPWKFHFWGLASSLFAFRNRRPWSQELHLAANDNPKLQFVVSKETLRLQCEQLRLEVDAGEGKS